MTLAGRTVAITRPRDQAAPLLARLAQAGARTVNFPVIETVPLDDPAPLRALAKRLDEFDLAFFVSPTAIAHTFDTIDRADWPTHLAVATVGPGSARALRERGFAHVIVPLERFDSEAVLAQPAFAAQAIAGRRVLILRGNGGRELLADTLMARGARVEIVSCYQRRRAQTDPAPLLACHTAGALDALVFTSSEGARFFVDIVGPEAQTILRDTVCFAPHERIIETLSLLGAQQVVRCEPGDEGIVAALERHFG